MPPTPAHETESLLAATKRTLEMIASGASLTAILDRLCHAIDAQNPAMMSTVLLADLEGRQLRPAAGPRVPSEWAGATAPVVIGPDVGSCGAAAFCKERVIVSDIATDPRWSGIPPKPSGALALAHGIRAAWSQPLVSKERVLGTFCMYYGQPCSPSATELQLIQDAAHIAVIAIEGERARAALKEAFAEIKQSEDRLRSILDAIPAQVYRISADGTLHYSNRRSHDYTGISREQAYVSGGHDDPQPAANPAEVVHTIMHPDDAERVTAKWEQELLPAGKAGEFEVRLRRHDGAYRWFMSQIEPMRDERGEIVGWCGTNTDIEDLKRAEEELRRSEAFYRSLFENISDCIFIIDVTPDQRFKVVSFNPAEERAVGMTSAQVAGRFTDDILPRELAEHVNGNYRRCVLARQIIRYEEVLDLPRGRVPFLTTLIPLVGPDGGIHRLIGLAADITERKRDEQELRQIIDLIPQLVVVLGSDGTPTYANRAMFEYTGFGLDDVKDPHLHARMSHPEDIARFAELRRDAMARGVPFETEERALRKDGKYEWFLVRYNPLRDERGQVLRWYATGTNIEDRKQAEVRMRNENLALREDIDHSSMFEEIIGSSLQPVLAQVAKVAETDSTVLILGETGTGKELLARAIHKRSRRSARAFIPVNCAAIPQSLVASELFGHEKGAFTGAVQRRLGRFEAADGGTIFLDEIGDLPAETQVALLRVLQEREFERVGSSHPIAVDVRVLAATNRDLEVAVERDAFREDLYYRLNVFPIRIPPLRERVDDIPVLVEYLVDRYAKKAGKRVRSIKRQTLQLFQAYDWPGNVRELQNVIERAVVLCEGETFAVDESWLKVNANQLARPRARLAITLAEREQALIESALAESHGRISGPAGAAAKLGIPRQTLESKIKNLHIDTLSFRKR